jgi:hypothetical protein
LVRVHRHPERSERISSALQQAHFHPRAERFVIRISSLIRHSGFDIRHSR